MVFEQARRKPAPHGIQAGVGTVLILRLAALLRTTLLCCKEVRPRYTLLQLLWDLELPEPLAEQAAARSEAELRIAP